MMAPSGGCKIKGSPYMICHDSMEDEKRRYITAGMMGLCLILGIIGLLGSSWLVAYGETTEMKTSLGELSQELESAEMCNQMVSMSGVAECDGATWVMSWSEACDVFDDDGDSCAMGTAGTVAKVFLWLGVILSLFMTIMAVLPMAGIDWMDRKIPDKIKTILSWTPGSLVLIGVMLWILISPNDVTDGYDLGMSAYMAILAGLLGLSSTVLDKYEIDVKFTRR